MLHPGLLRIGIFDSGIGGLSVLRAVRARLPAAALTYVADTRHTPWGERSGNWISARCLQLAGWLIDDGCDLVLVACNTGTTQAIAALRARWPGRPFVGVEPGIKPAAAASRNGRVAVMATPGTLRSPRWRQLVDAHAGRTRVLALPCPGLADAIEAAIEQPARLDAMLDGIAATLRTHAADTVALGCTHYPLVADALAQRLGPDVRLIDTADAVAQRVAQLLGVGALAPEAAGQGGEPARSIGSLRLLATAEPDALRLAAGHWLGLSTPATALDLPDPDATGTAPEGPGASTGPRP
jgi:glutamate racemase